MPLTDKENKIVDQLKLIFYVLCLIAGILIAK